MPAKSKTRKPDYKKKNYMREHYVRQGLTMTEIGNLNGVSAMTIRAWLVKLGIPTRARGVRHPLNPKWSAESETTADSDPTITVRRCTACGKSGHNSRTCGKPVSDSVIANELVAEIQEKPSKSVKVIPTKNQTDVDPAVQHLRTVRDKLLADLSNVEQALSLIENL